MGRLCIIAGILLSGALCAGATTLEQMSLEELIRQSTAVVRGTPRSARVERDGSLIYTVYSLAVSDRWKGEPGSNIEVSLPGGSVGGVTQNFGGVPHLETGHEYIVLLWTGPSGRTQIIGLTQGLFSMRGQAGAVRLVQASSPDVVLLPGSAGTQQLDLSLSQFVQSVRAIAVTNQ